MGFAVKSRFRTLSDFKTSISEKLLTVLLANLITLSSLYFYKFTSSVPERLLSDNSIYIRLLIFAYLPISMHTIDLVCNKYLPSWAWEHLEGSAETSGQCGSKRASVGQWTPPRTPCLPSLRRLILSRQGSTCWTIIHACRCSLTSVGSSSYPSPIISKTFSLT
jgi:hypothetical protein